MPHSFMTQLHWGTTSNTLFLGGKVTWKSHVAPDDRLDHQESRAQHTPTPVLWGRYSHPWCCSQGNEPMTPLSTLAGETRHIRSWVFLWPSLINGLCFVLFLFWNVQKSGKLWFKRQPFGSLERLFPDRALQLLHLSDPSFYLTISVLHSWLWPSFRSYGVDTKRKAISVSFVWALPLFRQGLATHPWLAWD